MGLKDLEESLARKEAEQKHERERREREEQCAAEIAQQACTIEVGLYDEKVSLARKILAWAKDFSANEIYSRIRNVSISSHGVYIYGDGWGHKVPHNDNHGCWSRIYVTPDGNVLYWSGYKWMPAGPDVKLKNAVELASLLNHHYLSELWQAIETKKVYDNAEKWHFRR